MIDPLSSAAIPRIDEAVALRAREQARDAFDRSAASFQWPRGSAFDAFAEARMRSVLEGVAACEGRPAEWSVLALSRIPVDEAWLLLQSGILSHTQWEAAGTRVWSIRLRPLSSLRHHASELHLWLSLRRLLHVLAAHDATGLAHGLVLHGAGAQTCGPFCEWRRLMQDWAAEHPALPSDRPWPVWRVGHWPT